MRQILRIAKEGWRGLRLGTLVQVIPIVCRIENN